MLPVPYKEDDSILFFSILLFTYSYSNCVFMLLFYFCCFVKSLNKTSFYYIFWSIYCSSEWIFLFNSWFFGFSSFYIDVSIELSPYIVNLSISLFFLWISSSSSFIITSFSLHFSHSAFLKLYLVYILMKLGFFCFWIRLGDVFCSNSSS